MAIMNDGQVTYVGAVLDRYEENGYDDSDFHAVVWDEGTQSVRSVCYGTTRYAFWGHAEADATDEVLEKALAWYRERWTRYSIEDAHAAAAIPGKGDRVRSTTTRGKNKGVEGIIRWVGEDSYSGNARQGIPAQKRYGIAVDGEEKLRYLNQDKIEMVDGPRPVDEDAIREKGTTARPANWRSALLTGLTAAMISRI